MPPSPVRLRFFLLLRVIDTRSSRFVASRREHDTALTWPHAILVSLAGRQPGWQLQPLSSLLLVILLVPSLPSFSCCSIIRNETSLWQSGRIASSFLHNLSRLASLLLSQSFRRTWPHPTLDTQHLHHRYRRGSRCRGTIIWQQRRNREQGAP